ncbi:MAG TPA: LamG domain-containing protein [Haliangium sp.]|nr:LamG domain-containing protein [Haliangium sp.]
MLGSSCSFQPGGLSGSPGTDGGSPDARVEIPDARVVDAARMVDAAEADAGRDAGVPLDLTLGLLAYWPLDVIEGTSPPTTPDVVGGFDGEVRGTASIVSGHIDGAISLDGSSGFVRIANTPELDFAGIITLAAWCRPRAIDGFRIVVAHGTSFSPNGEVYLRLEADDYQAGSWNGGDHRAVSPIPPDDRDTWVHLAGVYDGETWRLYRNGVEVDTGGDIGAVTVNEVWAIGARSRASADRFFQGEIDEVRIYDRALSVEEIGALVSLRPQ